MYKVRNFVVEPDKNFFATIESEFNTFNSVRNKVNLDLDSLEGGRVPFPFRIEIFSTHKKKEVV